MHQVQYADSNIGPKSYEGFGENLLVTKVFTTLQGEGPFAGQKAVFIRLAGCDRGDKRSCQFCDTDFRFSQGTTMSVETLVRAALDSFQRDGEARLVVITGGEPMLQNNTTKLVEGLLGAGIAVQIESNGDRLSTGFHVRSSGAILVVSPKVVPSTLKYRVPPDEVLERIDYLKFVVEADSASPYYKVPEWAGVIMPPPKVYVSPITVYKRDVAPGEVSNAWKDDLVDRVQTERNYRHAARQALRNGYRLSIQMHTLVVLE